jgi:uncharacterized protein (TIGR02145 family)
LKTLVKITLAICIACGFALAQKEKVVIDFSGKQPKPGSFELLYSEIRKVLSKDGRYTTVSRNAETRQLLAKEQKTQHESGAVDNRDPDKLAQIGRHSAAKYVIAIKVTQFGKEYLIDAVMVDVGTALDTVSGNIKCDFSDIKSVQSAATSIANQLLGIDDDASGGGKTKTALLCVIAKIDEKYCEETLTKLIWDKLKERNYQMHPDAHKYEKDLRKECDTDDIEDHDFAPACKIAERAGANNLFVVHIAQNENSKRYKTTVIMWEQPGMKIYLPDTADGSSLVKVVTEAINRALYGQGTKGKYTDKRNGKDPITYDTMRIANNVWMLENLKYRIWDSWSYEEKSFANTWIPFWKAKQRRWPSKQGKSNVDMYGRLYSYDAATKNTGNDEKNACPSGWRLPDSNDWSDLVYAAGGDENAKEWLRSSSTVAGAWVHPGTNSLEFSAMPGGYRKSDDGRFYGAGKEERYWGENVSNPIYSGAVHGRSSKNGFAFSIRCVKILEPQAAASEEQCK